MASMPDSTVRLWVQTESGQYPTTARLDKTFPLRFSLATCRHCEQGVPETLGHVQKICLRFQEARTEAHNRCWRSIIRSLEAATPRFFLDKPMSDAGILAESEEPAVAGTSTGDQRAEQLVRNKLRLRPDAVAVSQVLRKQNSHFGALPTLPSRSGRLPPTHTRPSPTRVRHSPQKMRSLTRSTAVLRPESVTIWARVPERLVQNGVRAWQRTRIQVQVTDEASWKHTSERMHIKTLPATSESFGREGRKLQVLPWEVGAGGDGPDARKFPGTACGSGVLARRSGTESSKDEGYEGDARKLQAGEGVETGEWESG
jgi:hypothetical protein